MKVRLHLFWWLQSAALIASANSFNCSCGKPHAAEGRSFNGTDFEPHQFPFLVSIWRQKPYQFVCGGALISSKDVLTSAICLMDQIIIKRCYRATDISNLIAFINDNDRGDEYDGQLKLEIDTYKIHPFFNPDSFEYNFGIIRLKNFKLIESMKSMSPVCMPWDVKEQFANQNLIFMGWTQSNINETKAQYIIAMGMDNNQCQPFVNITVKENFLCVTDSQQKNSICDGDRGGPLVLKVKGRYTVTGVPSSFGRYCPAKPSFPGVFARVSNQMKWIVDNSEAENCQDYPEWKNADLTDLTPAGLETYECKNCAVIFCLSENLGVLLVVSAFMIVTV